MRGFVTIVYHEVRTGSEAALPLEVADGYRDRLPPALYISKDEFTLHMDALHAHGYHTLSLDDIADFLSGEKSIPERSVHITFDDMYQSVLRNAYPLLKRYGFRASGFVPCGWIFDAPSDYLEEKSRTLSWPELQGMRDVFEYAHHTSFLHRRDDDGSLFVRAARDEIIKDLHEFRDRLDRPRVFAYPFGVYNGEGMDAAAEAGVELAFTTVQGVNSRKTRRLEMHRSIVVPGTDPRTLLQLVQCDTKER